MDNFLKYSEEELNKIALTEELIRSLPKIDLHVHLPGTISASTAWQLALRNRFITVENGKWYNGPLSLDINDPHEHYSDIFQIPDPIIFDEQDIPRNLRYNIALHNFKSFDAVMATVQGHRHPPGGIQNEEDLRLILRAYLRDCIAQNIFYTEVQQNIRIAYNIYPGLSAEDARRKLYYFLKQEVEIFAEHGVYLRFLHCFNKTQAAGLAHSTEIRALEAAAWLKETKELIPGIFVGLESAGHEKDESGWPIHLKAGYEAAASMGFGCEAHGGEGIGVEHLLDVVNSLPVSRVAHGFQIIESKYAIEEVKSKNVTLLMSPIINIFLGACIHYCPEANIPKANSYGGKKKYVQNLNQHPLFILLREYKLKISLCSDNPQIAGIPIQTLFMVLAGIKTDDYVMPEAWLDNSAPLKTGELVSCLLNGINAAFCSEDLKKEYLHKLEKSLDAVIHKLPGV